MSRRGRRAPEEVIRKMEEEEEERLIIPQVQPEGERCLFLRKEIILVFAECINY